MARPSANLGSGYTNEQEMRVIGMSRSGNHAILNWIFAQAPPRTCLLNCAEGKENPFLTARPMDSGRPYRANYEFDLEREQRGRLSAKNLLLFSHEDNFLGNAVSDAYEREHDGWVGPTRRRRDVLILRDPFNLFASRLRAGSAEVGLTVAKRIWKQHAREFIQGPSRLRHDPVLIRYNQWFTDRDYRRALADRLGLTFTDAGLREVAACHGGSSFDGLAYDGDAQQMGVLSRWKHYAADAQYRMLFDEELIEMSESIFGPIPGTRELLGSAAVQQAG
ncbi:MAG: hypothetical protein ACLFV3_02915 [Phycisphaeraceae bacterium]